MTLKQSGFICGSEAITLHRVANLSVQAVVAGDAIGNKVSQPLHEIRTLGSVRGARGCRLHTTGRSRRPSHRQATLISSRLATCVSVRTQAASNSSRNRSLSVRSMCSGRRGQSWEQTLPASRQSLAR